MIYTLLAILGSLGLFLYGMKVLSEGLQKVSGEGLRNLMRNMTKNRFYGLGSGMVVTTLVQSSTATTVMLVSFVNAGLLNLRQAVGIVLGANLGTTTTFWMIALIGFKFSMTDIALPAIGIGVAMIFFRQAKIRDLGQTLIGFGILFLGLELMKQGIPDVESNPEMFSFLSDYAGRGYVSLIIFFFFGVVLTFVVQSSSVAGAITLTLAAKGWIDYESAAAIVLGENVGTTITANIAAAAGNTESKRTARAHLLFNVIGVIWMFVIFIPFTNFVEWLMPGDPNHISNIPMHLAMFHSLFNFVNICLLIGFVPQLANWATRMVPEKQSRFKFSDPLRYMGSNLPRTGEINLAEAQREVLRMADLTQSMFHGFNEVYENPDKDMGGKVKELKEMEERSDRMAFEITQYLIYCATSELSQDATRTVTGLLRVVSEMEEICDCCYNLVRLAERKYRKKRVLPPETQEEIRVYSEQVNHIMDYYRRSLDRKVSMADLETAQQMERSIDRSRKKLRKEAVKRMSDPSNIKSEMLYIDILYQIEKVGNHSMNILEVLGQRD